MFMFMHTTLAKIIFTFGNLVWLAQLEHEQATTYISMLYGSHYI
jgi:hypothetical protein